MKQIIKYSILLTLVAIQFGVFAQQQEPIRNPNENNRQQQPNTVILSERDYEELVRRANNPDCPTCPNPNNTRDIDRDLDRDRANAKRGIALRLGLGANYMYGADDSNDESFDSDFISWYGEGMLGYVVNYNQKGLGTVLGAFIQVGNTNERGIEKFLNDGGFLDTANESQNLYYQAELGAVLFETIRISSGTGYQRFNNVLDDTKEIYYYSTTAGLEFGSRYLKFSANLNFLYGRDLEDGTILRPTVGIVFQL